MTNGTNESDAVERMIAGDLRSLKQRTLRDLPTIDHTAQLLREQSARSTREGFLMKTARLIRMRPWLATACGVAVIAVILLAVPISYTRTAGYDLRLGFPSSTATAEQITAIARSVQTALHTESMSISFGQGGSGSTIQARIGPLPRPMVEAALRAFAANLSGKGIPVATEIRPLTERISTNLYAYASTRVTEIRVNGGGKTNAQIEDEIRSRLESSGFSNPSVSITQDGDSTRIQIQMEPPAGQAPGDSARVQLQLQMDPSAGH